MTDYFPNIPRIYTALSEWLACLILLLPLLKDRNRVLISCELFLALLIQAFLQHLVGTWPLPFWIPGMLLNILWMFLTIFFNWKAFGKKDYLFIC
ncbi:hypothetical protein MFLO_11115 [Listeria floridensis FSL S10-1187]|uniref:Uncharacterized protein n=1 Tax=Listeria floridensis FSL S10-1187 TaxID=1265817 RepID=A0ABP3AW80_9LIST|nr:hypothetical protein MFLO_11115 [Listeria floridensis FSL S10-1187]